LKTLVINTYGGSLLLGARALNLEIIGSYEDTGFGLSIQQANFPELEFRAMRKDWPTQNLSEVFVIAHPPCSAFSVQNVNQAKKGVDSAAFACTRSVLQYAVDNKAVGIAIESVVGALAGAWRVHQHYADTYGYSLYRVLESGAMFGAQWRDRFWVVYIKKGAAPELMPWTLYPRWQTVREIVGELSGPSPAGLDHELEKLRAKFAVQAGCTPEELEKIFGPNPEEMCSVDDRLWRLKFPNENRWDVCKRYVTKFASSAMVMLDPNGLCPVLLGSSWWYMDSRNLSETAYKQLMGFPDNYIFPEGTARKDNYRADMRTYLSKGVMPPIASWVLENSLKHLRAIPECPRSSHGSHSDPDNSGMCIYCALVLDPEPHEAPYRLEIMPDMIADFRIRKKTWGEARPELRHEDEYGVARTFRTSTQPVWVPVVQPTAKERSELPAPKPEQAPRLAVRQSKSPWNSPELEDSLRETLFIRPNTADAYALHESHGYHRLGVKAGDVMLDLGAHIGCVASRAALIGAAKVISIEAELENFTLLQQNTRTFQNVECYNAAVYGGTDPTVTLHRVARRDDGGYSTGTHSCVFTTRGGTVEVPRLDFRELLEEYKPTVIKCDIEGSEWTLDWSNLPTSVRSIGIEYHHRYGRHKDKMVTLHELLTSQGFAPVHNLNLESKFSAIIAFYARGKDEDPHDGVHAPSGQLGQAPVQLHEQHVGDHEGPSTART